MSVFWNQRVSRTARGAWVVRLLNRPTMWARDSCLAQPSSSVRICPFPEVGHVDDVERAPRSFEREVEHELAELVLTVNVLYRVVLIDDIDQVMRLGLSPKDLPHPGEHHPPVSEGERAGFTEVEVAPVAVVPVDSEVRAQSSEL